MNTVYWTTFPAHALTGTKWDDHLSAHASVMRLFPSQLAGDRDRRRSGAGILYRYEAGDVPRVLVQSALPPELLPAEAKAMSVPELVWDIPTGAPVAARLCINTVERSGRVTRVVPQERLEEWLTERLGAHLDELNLLNVTTSSTTGRRKDSGRPPVIVSATVDLTGVVRDDTTFEKVRREGIGRARAYGAGLLTARRIG